MDRSKYRLRPFAEDDYASVCRLNAAVAPESTSTPEEERAWDELLSVRHRISERWMVEERATGKVVAFGAMDQSPFEYDPHKFRTNIVVDPDHRGNGIGRAIASLLEGEAEVHRALAFSTGVRKDDAVSVGFAERRGFRELRTTWMSILDPLASPIPSRSERSRKLSGLGVRFTTLAAEDPSRPEVRRRLLELMNEASRDVPRMGVPTPVTLEELDAQLRAPALLPEAFFLARVGETYVGMSNLENDLTHADRMIVGFTGTLEAYRGQGIATELKWRAVEYARDRGIRALRTFNDSQNEPIWAVNQKLGFRRAVEWSQRERLFSAPSPPAPGSG